MPLKVLRKPDLNIKVVLNDIFSDFKNSNEKYRLCFKEVFDQNSRIYETTDRKDEINSILQVYLSLDERGSEFVCSECENKINNLHQFKRKIDENHENFEKFSSLKYDNVNNDNFIKTEPELSKYKESDFKNCNEECSLCFKDVFYQKSKIHLTDDIKDKIYSILQINFSVGGTGSEILCIKCENEINIFHRFKEMIHEKQKYFKMFSMKKDKANYYELTLALNEQLVKSEPELSICSESIFDEVKEETSESEHENQNDSIEDHLLESNITERKVQASSGVAPCNVCGKQFKNRHYLRQHYIRVHMNLRPHQCDICGKRFPRRCDVATHIKTHRERKKKKYNCDRCESSFFSKGDLRKHELKFHKDDIKPHQCNICGRKFLARCRLDMHMDTHRENRTKDHHCDICKTYYFHKELLQTHISRYHEDKPLSCTSCGKGFKLEQKLKIHSCSNLKKSVQSTKKYECDICGRIIRTQKNFFYHMDTHRENRTKDHLCVICECSFFNSIGLRDHMLRHHEVKLFSCSLCRKTFKLKRNLESHICSYVQELNDSQQFTHCQVCGKIFKNAFRLKRHQRVHVNSKLYECDICGRKIQSRKTFFYHMEIHRGKKTRDHHCNMCKSSFFNNERLRQHISRYHEDIEKPFSCTTCGNIFKLEQNLKIHICKSIKESYKNQKGLVYACEICGKVFKIGSQLRTHNRRVHLKIKTYHCDICDKSFYAPSLLAMHMETHRENRTRDYHCYVCKTSYFRKGSLKRHKLDYHGNKSFSCTLCGRTFKYKEGLKIHSCSYFKELNKSKNVKLNKLNSQGRTMNKTNKLELKCDICDKKFYSRGLIARHMKIHRENRTKDYQCHICKNSYFEKRSLQNHIFRSHEEKKFPCDCGKIFKLKRNLESHTCRYYKLIKANELA